MSLPASRALTSWLCRQAATAISRTVCFAWEHRQEVASAARAVGRVGISGARLAGRGVRTVVDHRQEIGQVAAGAVRGGATATVHLAAPFTTRRQIEAEYQAVRRQADAYKRLTDRRYEVIARARARRETLMDALMVGGHSLASFGEAVKVRARIERAYELAYPNLAESHGFAEHVRSLNVEQLTGFAAGVKGKLFELKLVEELNKGGLPEGYRAVLADSPVQPGHDVEILGPDGQVTELLQAKAADSVAYVRDALERYPHIDVIGTHEVASQMTLLGLSDRVADSGITDESLERLVGHAIDVQSVHMDFTPSLLVLSLIAWTTFKGGRPLFEQGRTFGERSVKSYVAFLAGGGAAVVTQLWWIAIPAAVGARVLMGSGERATRHLEALRELRKANDRVLRRMRRENKRLAS